MSQAEIMGLLEYKLTRKPFLIGVAGGTSSGKTTVCKKIMEKLKMDDSENRHKVIVISQESFYKELNSEESEKASRGLYNFDHPDAIDNDLCYQSLLNIVRGQEVDIPEYNFITNSRSDSCYHVGKADVVLLEGILVFYFKEIRELFHMKLFVDTDADTRLSRRVLRDVQERGRDLDLILTQYTNFVKPAFEEFCLPTKKFADVIIPRGAANTVAIELIVQHVLHVIETTK